MPEFEIRLVAHSGRVQVVYLLDVESFQEAIKKGDELVRSDEEVAGAQVQSEPPLGIPSVH